MNTNLNAGRAIALLSAVAVMFAACSETPVSTTPPVLTVPSAYTFESRFTTGTSSVSYEGQIVRHLLIQDLTSAIAQLARPGAQAVSENELLSLYEYSDASNLSTTTTITGTALLEARYSAIASGKNLVGKVSAASIVGMGAPADVLIRGWIRTVVANSQDPAKLGTPSVLVDENGLDIAEILGKVLLGSVAYDQGTAYMAAILDQNNAVAATDSKGAALPFTVMEHNWDEAFGYFGAARDFARYTDAQLAGTSAEYAYDSNGDGKIDLRSEYNYSFARYAGRRDKAAGTDFTKAIFDAFLAGRTAITSKGTSDHINGYRRAAIQAWEKVLAATVVHYINEVESTMRALDTTAASISDLRHEWSEMKGYAVTLQFNSMKAISDARLAELHSLIGPSPVLAAVASAEHAEYLASLSSARSIIKSVYGFTDAQMSAW